MKFSFTIPPELDGERLDRALVHLAERDEIPLSRSDAKRRIESGSVSLNDNFHLMARERVQTGDRVDANLPAPRAEGDAPVYIPPIDTSLIDLRDAVLYQDALLLAVDKPAGLPTHATPDPARDHCQAAVERILRYQGVEAPYVAVHHRLDVDTSGVLLFAIDERANKPLTETFRQHVARKTYVALVVDPGSLADAWRVENHLKWDKSTRRNEAVHAGGDHARTEFRILKRGHGLALVEAIPETGRRHQIRAHLAQSGAPILGDLNYGGPMRVGARTVDRVMLHALRLEVEHPLEKRGISIESSLPLGFEVSPK